VEEKRTIGLKSRWPRYRGAKAESECVISTRGEPQAFGGSASLVCRKLPSAYVSRLCAMQMQIEGAYARMGVRALRAVTQTYSQKWKKGRRGLSFSFPKASLKAATRCVLMRAGVDRGAKGLKRGIVDAWIRTRATINVSSV